MVGRASHPRNGDFAGVSHKMHVEFESPAQLLTDVATLESADLIIVGAHGRHGIAQLILGSVSQSILRNAPCPVLILGPACELHGNALRTILLAGHLKHTNLRAAQYATRIANDRNGRLYLMQVLNENPPSEDQQRKWIETDCAKKLMQMLEPSDRQKIATESLIAYGCPAQEILSAAIAKHIDLLVLGVGEHGPLSDRAPWRTLTEIVQNARCPILCVR